MVSGGAAALPGQRIKPKAMGGACDRRTGVRLAMTPAIGRGSRRAGNPSARHHFADRGKTGS